MCVRPNKLGCAIANQFVQGNGLGSCSVTFALIQQDTDCEIILTGNAC